MTARSSLPRGFSLRASSSEGGDKCEEKESLHLRRLQTFHSPSVHLRSLLFFPHFELYWQKICCRFDVNFSCRVKMFNRKLNSFRRFLHPLTDVCSAFSSSEHLFYFIEPNIRFFFREIRDEESSFLNCTNLFQKTSSKLSQTLGPFHLQSHNIRIPSISGCLTIINIKVFQRYLIGTLSYMTSLSSCSITVYSQIILPCMSYRGDLLDI